MLLLMTHNHSHEQKSSPAIIVNGLHLFGAYTHSHTLTHTQTYSHTDGGEAAMQGCDLLSRSSSRVSVSLVSMPSGGAPSVGITLVLHTQAADSRDVQCGG